MRQCDYVPKKDLITVFDLIHIVDPAQIVQARDQIMSSFNSRGSPMNCEPSGTLVQFTFLIH